MKVSKSREPSDYLILPLDVNSREEALRLVGMLKDMVGTFKVGLELFVSVGPGIIRDIKEASGKRVFLDLKLNDIPETVSKCIRAAISWGVDFLTIHPDEAKEALRRLSGQERERTRLLGVTVLTSLDKEKLTRLGFRSNLAEDIGALVRLRAEGLIGAGVDGLVCSGKEVKGLREVFPDALLVVPGIRPQWSLVEGEDQKRITQPRDAVLWGADFLVIGRPILKDPDPKAAADRVLEEIGSVL